MNKLKKIFTLPKIVGQINERGWDGEKLLLVEVYPEYDERFLIIHENPFGIEPIPFQPQKVVRTSQFKVENCIMTDYYRRKWQKVSEEYSYIYALSFDNIPFYVGSTKNSIRRRHWQHVRNICYTGRYQPPRKPYPKIHLLCEVISTYQFEEEKRWILGAKKKYKLKNIVHNNNCQ